MLIEDYVSFETAKLLKEKGFENSEPTCINVFKGHTYKIQDNEIIADDDVTIPTLQMAMRWLREVHKLGVFPTTFYREMGNKVKHDYGSTIVRLDTFEIIGNKNIEDYTFAADTYEETAEKTIKYCLENLI